MNFELEDTAFSEIKILRTKRFTDERGYFMESFKNSDAESLGLPKFCQDNISLSHRGVIRGLHWQIEPFGQGKLVTCLTGSILDVAVDIRKQSSTFGQYICKELSADKPESFWIPSGFAHGFQALEDNTRVLYKVNQYWEKSAERSLNYLDSDIGIQWHDIDAILSEKDLLAPMLNELD